jgi:hypothetical protein
LERLPYLDTLHVFTGDITDSGVAHIGKLHRLKELLLISDAVSDHGLTFLRNLKELRSLQLRCSVTNKGIAHLSSLKKLETIQIGGSTTDSLRAIDTLQTRVKLDFNEAPLREVIDYVSSRHNLLIRIDDKALQDAEISLDGSVTTSASGMSLGAALENILKLHALRWMITPAGLVITTRNKVDAKLAGIDRLRESLPNLKEVYFVVDVPWVRRSTAYLCLCLKIRPLMKQ